MRGIRNLKLQIIIEQSYVYRLFGYFDLIFLVFSILSIQPVHSQNANERDIQLPEPANPELPSIYLIGDSTVRNGSGDGANNQWGWGSFLAPYFDSTRVNVVNRAIGGRSSRTYITQGYWDQQLKLLKQGDLVLIQFGHNDASPVNDTSRARGVIDGIGDEKRHIFNKLTREEETVYTYGAYLRTYISDIRKKGATPVICSPVPTHGKVIDKLDDFVTWAEKVAITEGVAFLDLNEIISREYEKPGVEKVQSFFVEDGVHNTRKGAQLSAKLVTAALKGLRQNPVKEYFSKKAENVIPRTGKEHDVSLPVVIGYGKGLFKVGDLLYSDDFKNADDWVVQMEETEAEYEPQVDFINGFLEVLIPGRGATIWNRNEFNGNITITYKVKASSTFTNELGMVVRDINTFWHASHPGKSEEIFNDDRYTGAFTSYHTLQGFYTSFGGRDNTTTRFRRYPRVKNDKQVTHISLSKRDRVEKYLIQPNKTYKIQLVIFDDVVQYIVDGVVFYEIREGDRVTVTQADGTIDTVKYSQDQFPAYSKGLFGFRLVNTHHIYSNFRVYRLEAIQ